MKCPKLVIMLSSSSSIPTSLKTNPYPSVFAHHFFGIFRFFLFFRLLGVVLSGFFKYFHRIFMSNIILF